MKMPNIKMKCVDCGKESKSYHISNFMQTKVGDGEEYRCNKCAPKYYRKKSNIVTYKCIDCGKEKTSPV
jgi:DNA-directed RNA polymerase subunit RPC12/RpoP